MYIIFSGFRSKLIAGILCLIAGIALLSLTLDYAADCLAGATDVTPAESSQLSTTGVALQETSQSPLPSIYPVTSTALSQSTVSIILYNPINGKLDAAKINDAKSWINIDKDHPYEVRIIYNFTDQEIIQNSRFQVLVPSDTIHGSFTDENQQLRFRIESFAKQNLYDAFAVLKSSFLGFKITVTSRPVFYNDHYPDGITLDEAIFTNGITMSGITGAESGCISFYINTAHQESKSTIPIWVIPGVIGATAGAVCSVVYNKRKAKFH